MKTKPSERTIRAMVLVQDGERLLVASNEKYALRYTDPSPKLERPAEDLLDEYLATQRAYLVPFIERIKAFSLIASKIRQSKPAPNLPA